MSAPSTPKSYTGVIIGGVLAAVGLLALVVVILLVMLAAPPSAKTEIRDNFTSDAELKQEDSRLVSKPTMTDRDWQRHHEISREMSSRMRSRGESPQSR